MAEYHLTDPVQWVEKYGDSLYRFAFLRLRDKEQAEDMVQETFMAALRARENFAGTSTEKTWLIGILKHKLVDHFRKTYRESPLPGSIENTTDHWLNEQFDKFQHWRPAPHAWKNPYESLEDKDFWRVLFECIDSIPSHMTTPFLMRVLDDMAYEEVCEVMNVTKSNLGVILHRVRLRVRRCLEDHWFRKGNK